MNKKILIVVFIVLAILLIGLIANLIVNTKNKETNEGNDMNETKNPIVVLETTKGNIEIELDTNHAPVTVANFLNYVNAKHYDGLVFHRVIKGFMIQGGGFDINGIQKKTNAPIILESNNGLKNLTGTIAMARTSVPNSATSQFFINTADNDLDYVSNSNPGYAVFGKVISGMEIVTAIENVSTGNRGSNENWPKENVIITKAYVK